jgi:hypothetical protein
LDGDTNYFSKVMLVEKDNIDSLTTSNVDVGGATLTPSSCELEDGCLREA